jgi:transposase-like protein
MDNHSHDFSWQVCHNPECSMFNKKGCNNIKVHAHGGIKKDIHELRCTCCHTLFSEHKGTPYFGIHTPRGKVLEILKLLVEGNGIRGTERITGVHRDTVTSILVRTGEHLEKVTDEFLADLKANEIQFDELWTFVKKRKPSTKILRMPT